MYSLPMVKDVNLIGQNAGKTLRVSSNNLRFEHLKAQKMIKKMPEMSRGDYHKVR